MTKYIIWRFYCTVNCSSNKLSKWLLTNSFRVQLHIITTLASAIEHLINFNRNDLLPLSTFKFPNYSNK